ncbi:FkbM family methyltransferase [Iodidimonas sp. SYSU 1G8]|uniref:FkbM family methyltransferase n=1 Tax=Iodidimonas sp. SYSU 1G8 TaxID=3133967 RepID=UPI0031FF3E92
MLSGFIRPLAMRLIRAGIPVPASPIDRYLEFRQLRKVLTDLKIDCVIDVGANRGQFAQDLRAIGFAGHIASFEPVPSEFAAMQRAMAGDRLWRGYNMALGSRNEAMTMNVADNSVMSSLLEPVHGIATTHAEEVQVCRLDECFAGLFPGVDAPRVFLKMDTQGYDLEVFRGASGCMDQVLGLQSEVSVKAIYAGMPHYLDALRLYEDAGFALQNLSVVGRFRTGALCELNALMRRP